MSPAVVVLAGLLTIAVLDGAFAGFRASVGRTGLIRHRTADRKAARSGIALLSTLLLPAATVLAVDVFTRSGRLATYQHAGLVMLDVYLPYGVVVLLSLAGYLTLHWRRRFLASALLLGPLTLVRPLIAAAGTAAVFWKTHDVTVTLVAMFAACAVLLVEPITGRRYER